MTGERWRLRFRIVRDDGTTETTLSTIPLSAQEAKDQIVGEGFLHRISGWEVTPKDYGILCQKAGMRREVRAIRCEPMTDVMPDTQR